eukprot:SAG31_NODE_3530_length_4152_cov_1.164569_3_plen_142_part_00
MVSCTLGDVQACTRSEQSGRAAKAWVSKTGTVNPIAPCFSARTTALDNVRLGAKEAKDTEKLVPDRRSLQKPQASTSQVLADNEERVLCSARRRQGGLVIPSVAGLLVTQEPRLPAEKANTRLARPKAVVSTQNLHMVRQH